MSARRFAPLALLILAAFAPAPAAAAGPDPKAPASASTAASRIVVPPVPLETPVSPVDVTGPSSAVTLELVVGANGRVESVTLVDGTEPLATIALRAANAWRFSPALVDGHPVAARIRFTVRFDPTSGATSPPAPEHTAASRGQAPSTPSRAEEPGSKLNEVTVHGSRVGISGVSLSRVEIRELPGALGDPFRAIDSVPGVTPIVSGLPYFFIRGAPPGNVGYYLDGIRVPLLFHLFFGPSVVHPSLIDEVELYRGAYPARFGRFAGAIVSADLAPLENRFRGEAQIRLFDAGALVETPFADGRGHVVVAGRYSYTAAAISLLSSVNLDYWDYQTLIAYDLTKDDRIGVLAFGAHDRYDTPGQDLGAHPEFHRIDLRYDRNLGGGDQFRAAVTLGQDSTGNPIGTSRDRLVSPRFSYRGHLSRRVTLDAGADASVDRYDFTVLDPTKAEMDLEALFPTRTDRVFGAYAELSWRPEDWWSVSPGVRVDEFLSQGDTALAVDPRISAKFELSPTLRAIHTFGLAHQTPNFVPGVPSVQLAGIAGGLQTAWQASSGVEADLPEGLSGSATVFDNIFDHLTDPLGIAGDFFAHPETANIRAIGSSYGLELSLRRSLARRVGGFVSYTLSRTTRSHDTIHTLASTDRTHVLNTAVGYDLGRHWQVGARAVVTSGIPAQHITDQGHVYDGYGRAPPFVRLDLRVEKRWIINDHIHWSLTAELFNATLGTEVTSRTCTTAGCYNEYLGPVTIPSIGVEGAF